MKMQRSEEKLCLQWNDFRLNISSAFGDLRDDKEFTDVTLACEDGQQVEAHKVVLISSSPFFLNLLKRNKHPHPLVYMRGLKYDNLLSMLDFLYHGEANVYQENLDSFLVMADELQLKGLDNVEEDFESDLRKVSNWQSSNTTQNLFGTSRMKTSAQKLKKEVVLSPSTETAIALGNPSVNTNLKELDQKVKSLMSVSENTVGKYNTRAKICNVCGKEGQMINIMGHIESNHLTDISIPCNTCGKISSSRNALKIHKSRRCRFVPGLLSQ